MHDVTPVQEQQIREVMNSENPRLVDLPPSVRPGDALGEEACHLQLVIDSSANKVLKFYHASVPIAWGVVRVFCNDHPVIINYKIATNSDRVKCAFLHMLANIPGERSDKDGSSWDPSPEELRLCITFINERAPLANGHNEQFLWGLQSVRDNETPIFGWPMHVVSRACQNRSVGNSQAEPEHFFPLLLHDINETIVQKILPLVVPSMTTHGLVLLGQAGTGKTPLGIILGLALARHYVNARGPEGAVVGWRRSKQIDGFRERPGELHVPVLLDDPVLSRMNFEDLKSFLDVGETCLVDARYRAAKFVRNQTRILLNNEWNPEAEPDLQFHSQIGWADFKKMISTTFNDASMPHLMAILKRATVILAGSKAGTCASPRNTNRRSSIGLKGVESQRIGCQPSTRPSSATTKTVSMKSTKALRKP